MADLGPTKVYGDLQVTGGITGTVTGNADTATKLQTARTIGGVAFDGTANINLPGVNAAGNQSTTGNAATATKLATARTISLTGDVTGSVAFDGSGNVSITTVVVDDLHNHTIANVDGLQTALDGKLPLSGGTLTGRLVTSGLAVPLNERVDFNSAATGLGWSITETSADGFLRFQTRTGTDAYGDQVTINTTGGVSASAFTGDGANLTNLNAANLGSGTLPDARLSGTYTGVNITGNAATATKLATARTINGVAFDGTANISITDPTSIAKAGDTITGKIAVGSTTSRSAGMYGTYDSTKIGHVWSMGTGYAIPDDGSTFGSLYGMAYKHTNNATGGTMAGGHQIVFCSAGTPGSAIGLAGGIWTSGNVTAYSDIRVKTNIEVIPDALSKVMQIRGVTYDRIDRDGERQVGVIAQEVQAVLPEAVSGDDMLSVAYGNMVGLLVEAIKELKTELDKVKAELRGTA